jgi:tRNA-specific 2-thiouridylase
MTRALAMMSGGLDSGLAAKLIKDQGIEVIGICFKSYFFGEENAVKMAKQIGIRLEVIDFSEKHLIMVKNPKHGRGKNMNPCIDCHAMMMNYCGKILEEYNADFIITGEVLNQRPMSQNKQALNTVKKESGFSNKILRPLCALNLEPTEMELSGLVDREKLLDISGRSRKVQMELAEKWGIKDYPSPAGGCKLTEPNYSVRLKKALEINDYLIQYK